MLLSAVNSLQRLCTSHVLLYHSTYSVVPDSLAKGLHNVHPTELKRQIEWLKDHFQVVDVDEFVQNPGPGLAAITFDDGYECVFTEALAVLEALRVPCTVFINGNSLEGRPFWRDKIRFLINGSLVAPFVEFLRKDAPDAWPISADNFYRMTKDPRINSRRLDERIDGFLKERGVIFRELSHCVRDRGTIRPSPWVTIGNHSLNHYVLSSLSAEEQETEIRRNHEVIQSLGVRTSKIFSIPFGGDGDFNDTTVGVIRDLGYQGYLYSRGLLNLYGPFAAKWYRNHLPFADRYMVPSRYSTFQRRILRLALKSVKHRFASRSA